jgi:hypothetical protein
MDTKSIVLSLLFNNQPYKRETQFILSIAQVAKILKISKTFVRKIASERINHQIMLDHKLESTSLLK